jgi:hypothetical protein
MQFMAQLLAHPTEGEAVRLTIPERQFWARIEQASPQVFPSSSFSRPQLFPNSYWPRPR